MWSRIPGCIVVLFSTVVSDRKQMAREALDRLNVWEPSVYYTLGKESFFIAGHEICIRESLDSYGALIWPGVSSTDAHQQWNMMIETHFYKEKCKRSALNSY